VNTGALEEHTVILYISAHVAVQQGTPHGRRHSRFGGVAGDRRVWRQQER